MMFGRQRSSHQLVDRRLTMVSGVVFLAFLAVLTRLFTLQVLQHSSYANLASAQQLTNAYMSAERGQILARDHTNQANEDLYPLAANKVYYEVFVDPSQVTRPQNMAEALGQALGLEAASLVDRLTKSGDNYEPIKHKVSDQELEVVKQIELPGIHWREEFWRYYPDKEIGSHILGFFGYQDNAKKGKYGLEGYWDDVLAGVSTEAIVNRTAGGSLLAAEALADSPVQDGYDIILTIDRTIQYETCRALDRAVLQYDADNGSAIVLESTTGRILAICSSPGFDPNNYNLVESVSAFNNLAVYDQFEPGSVFKTYAMAAAIDDGQVTPSTTYIDEGVVKLAEYEIKNSDKKAHGLQSMTEVLEKSLNTGIIFATQDMANEVFRNYMENFGFGRKYNLGLDQEAEGDISSLNIHGQIHKATASFGQGITVTTLQLAAATNALANGGVLLQPYLIEEFRSPQGQLLKLQPKILDQVVKPETATQLAAMMVSVIDYGHGSRGAVPGYYIAGKTGTAQIPENGRYTNKTIQSFVGFGPISDPRFTIVTKLYNPKTAYAESSAAPLFGEIAKFLVNYYQIAPER